jgi:hypothetical protein
MFLTHGFAIHVTWEGNRGRDQFGDFWEKRGGFAYDENNIYKFKL